MKSFKIFQRFLLIFCLTLGILTLVDSCGSNTEYKQKNGLYYTFEGYIGPDSCELYCCDPHPETGANSWVYITKCKHDHCLTWQSGKTRMSNCIENEYPEFNKQTDTLEFKSRDELLVIIRGQLKNK